MSRTCRKQGGGLTWLYRGRLVCWRWLDAMKIVLKCLCVVFICAFGCQDREQGASHSPTKARTGTPLAILDARAAPAKCEVHNQPMQEDIVEILYGLVKMCPSEKQARESLFPHTNS